NELFATLRENLAAFDPAIAKVQATYGPERVGDVPHSLACIDKARTLLGYDPQFSTKQGLKAATEWYWENLC
ncbi:MAG: LPS biosynthesis protein WbpP, partial [Lentisphaerae bacterium]|nr:LPS biosynthesis protein WbpP [Lentisphaerota bacterium]